MDPEPHEISRLFEEGELEFMLAKSRVKMKVSVENIRAGDYGIDSANEGDSVEVPRWMAEELVRVNIAEPMEEPFEIEISKALSREKMMGPLQLSSVPPDFYVKMRRRVAGVAAAVAEGRTRREDLDRLRSTCYDLVGMRLSKLLSLSSASTSAASLGDRLSSEEKAFFNMAQGLSKDWKSAVLGEGS